MSTIGVSRTRIHPVSAEERQLVRNELAEVLKTSHFANSKRYPAFLKYTVEIAIEDQTADLKERTVGVEVFHRRPDYDTHSDTVVRFAAGEVRKRLALVYHESDFPHTVQIVLPSGSYVPEFFRVDAAESAPPAMTLIQSDEERVGPHELEERDSVPQPRLMPAAQDRNRWFLAAIGVCFVFAIAGTLFWLLHVGSTTRDSSLDRFWRPIHTDSASVLMATGANVFSTKVQGVAEAEKTDDYPYVSMVDVVALVALVDSFNRSHTAYLVKPASTATLTDLREHPVILLGAYNNPWTVRLLNDLRFRFAARPALQIYDATNPSRTWQRPAGVPYEDADDFAIVARFHDKLTDNMVIVVAGIGKNGTEAASQFVLTPRYLDQLNSQSNDWASRNVEVVLKTRVVDGKTGAPSIEAMYVW